MDLNRVDALPPVTMRCKILAPEEIVGARRSQPHPFRRRWLRVAVRAVRDGEKGLLALVQNTL
eukprot:7700220-Prorocentrum_lima.AAC.1